MWIETQSHGDDRRYFLNLAFCRAIRVLQTGRVETLAESGNWSPLYAGTPEECGVVMSQIQAGMHAAQQFIAIG